MTSAGELPPDVPRANGELVFAAPWESRAFGVTAAYVERLAGRAERREGAHERERRGQHDGEGMDEGVELGRLLEGQLAGGGVVAGVVQAGDLGAGRQVGGPGVADGRMEGRRRQAGVRPRFIRS